MKQAITYPTAEGGIAVVYPAAGYTIDQILDKDVPQGVSRAVVNAEELPDRYFREAWEFDGPKGAKVNVTKAQEVQRNVWRRMREPKLKALDIELMQALETGNASKRKEVADRKQALRDVTEIPLSDDLTQIKNTIPDILLP